MKRRELAMMSIGALRRKQRSLKIVLGILVGLLLIMMVADILVVIQNGFSLLTLTPLVFFVVVLNAKKNLDTVRMELLGRDDLLSPYTNQPRSWNNQDKRNLNFYHFSPGISSCRFNALTKMWSACLKWWLFGMIRSALCLRGLIRDS